MTYRRRTTHTVAGTLSPVQATSTRERSTEPPQPSYRSWSRAFSDLRRGWQQRPLWGYLGWQDIKQGYNRSVIGPLWITISMAVTAFALGVLYSTLFNQDLATHLPYLTVGFIVWNFIAGNVNEGASVFIANEGLIKQLPAPLSVHVYRLVWRQMLFFAHNLVVYVILMFIFPKPLGFHSLMAVPAFAVLAVNAMWMAILVGIISTRFRDIPPVTGSLMQLLFFMTPIVWNYSIIADRSEEVAAQLWVVQLNPFLHFLEIIRQPMLGEWASWHHWAIVGGITVLGWGAALVILRNYRARVSYWV
ncbi:ABC-2 type transporter [Actinoalloteichus hoggarensis]|uniref:ABC-2 type transporter n=1 Tax=Actinoalloteichus hoggarensis TaxID=1470176 RepID=A0A221VWD4_9PSEU|nr:ABC-2 type transporter [Actinoalloteichus hoggarensis]